MIKFVNKAKGKRGFSLVEVMVALAIFALFSLVVATVFQLVYVIHVNTDEINTQMNQQASILDNGSVDMYDSSKNYVIGFDGISDTIVSNGEKIAVSGGTTYKMPIRVFK